MSVLTREALEASPLADLHVIASELAIDGFRRLRKAELIDSIVGGTGGASRAEEAEEAAAAPARPRRRRASRSRDGETEAETAAETAAEPDADAEATPPARRRLARRSPDADADVAQPARRASRSRSRDEDADVAPAARGGRTRSRDEDVEVVSPARRGGRTRARDEGADAGAAIERDDDRREQVVEGVVDLQGNGSGFLRVGEAGNGELSNEDVYVSAAQVRRCELVSGDRVTGPVRGPRRSERHPSLIRIDTINGTPADEVAEGTRFDDLPCAFPSERFALSSEDPTLKAIEWLAPLGRGSRATIVGGARAGKTEALRRLVTALGGVEGLELSVVLLGVRPEEVGEWRAAGSEPTAALTLAATADSQGQALERTIDQAKRIAARGGHAVVLVDSLDDLPQAVARRALAAARNIVDGGSVTVVATAAAPVGGETTVIALDATLTAAGRFPALDLAASGTLRPELLVGEAGAEAIAQSRAG